jgi:hypothetical protein
MALEHILSELNNSVSISEPYEKLYNKHIALGPIVDEESLDDLIDFACEALNFKGADNLIPVDLKLVEIQVKVARTFINADSEEDFFI